MKNTTPRITLGFVLLATVLLNVIQFVSGYSYEKGRQAAGFNPTPEIVNNVVLYNALFDVENAGGELMTQMTAQVFFVIAQAK